MAKKTDEAGAQPAAVAPDEDIAIAVRAVQDITGCGVPEAQTRVKAMTAKKTSQIAQLERDGERPKIVAILF